MISPSKFTRQLAGQSLYTLPQFEVQTSRSAMEFTGFACFNTTCIIVSWKPMVKGSLQVKGLRQRSKWSWYFQAGMSQSSTILYEEDRPMWVLREYTRLGFALLESVSSALQETNLAAREHGQFPDGFPLEYC